MSLILDAPLTITALRMALRQRQPGGTLIVHSDRGRQFASAAYRQVLAEHGLLASVSRAGNCYDNAFIESFWSSLKYELVYHHRLANWSLPHRPTHQCQPKLTPIPLLLPTRSLRNEKLEVLSWTHTR